MYLCWFTAESCVLNLPQRGRGLAEEIFRGDISLMIYLVLENRDIVGRDILSGYIVCRCYENPSASPLRLCGSFCYVGFSREEVFCRVVCVESPAEGQRTRRGIYLSSIGAKNKRLFFRYSFSPCLAISPESRNFCPAFSL